MDMEKLGLVMEEWRIKQHQLSQQLPTSPEVKEIELEEEEKEKESPSAEELKEAVTEQSDIEKKESTSDDKKVEVVLVTEEPLSDDEGEKEPGTQTQLVVEEGKEVMEPSASACGGGSSLSVNDILILTATPDVMEPAAVAQVRAELATLVADKQRMEAHRRRLERKMDELDKQFEEHQEVL